MPDYSNTPAADQTVTGQNTETVIDATETALRDPIVGVDTTTPDTPSDSPNSPTGANADTLNTASR